MFIDQIFGHSARYLVPIRASLSSKRGVNWLCFLVDSALKEHRILVILFFEPTERLANKSLAIGRSTNAAAYRTVDDRLVAKCHSRHSLRAYERIDTAAALSRRRGATAFLSISFYLIGRTSLGS